MKAITLALGIIFCTSLCQADQPVFIEESLDSYNERMKWFDEAPYGMFIHFGLYSQLGGEWKGKKDPEKYAEWIQAHLGIPREEYAETAKTFNPAQFDADLIARTAKEAGMKYLVITSKHHEGFCLWDSEYTDFDVANTPFKGRDILGELSEACKKHGIKFGLYYSILDWHHPAQELNKNHKHSTMQGFDAVLKDSGESKKNYTTYQKNQILELIKKYDPAILWFDGDWLKWWTNKDGIELYNAIRAASPHVIVNNRVGKRETFEADYVTQEQGHFKEAFPKHWEACYTLNTSWGFKKGDNQWKNAATVYQKLKDVNEKGGNLLLNVGPDGNGVVQPEAIAILLETGKMLEANPIKKSHPTITAVPRLKQDKPAPAKEQANPAASAGLLEHP
jgi:alpha-L-fucosidase